MNRVSFGASRDMRLSSTHPMMGRVGTVRVGDAPQPGEEGCPTAFVAGGRTGSVRWAGGGGAGPHGNQRVGSMQKHVSPVYKAEWTDAHSVEYAMDYFLDV